MLKYARVGPIAVHLPERVETNAQLAAEFPRWDMETIGAKTGILKRHVAAAGECSSDLAVAACERLFVEQDVDRRTVDFLLLCTQTPDYPLPTTACLVQDRLGLPTHCGALDFNLGCSGYVYGLALADGLIRGGMARRVLLVTAETYTKYIAPDDRSLRTIFGDGATATLIDAAGEPSLSGFVFGTDGSGADALMVNRGACRPPQLALQPRTRHRWSSALYMDGPSLIYFALDEMPGLVEAVLKAAEIERPQVDLFLLHQATLKMLNEIRQRTELPAEKMPIVLENYGNTVSSTLPIVMQELRYGQRLEPGKRSMLLGFGVGYSWAGCLWRETWSGPRFPVVLPSVNAEVNGQAAR